MRDLIPPKGDVVIATGWQTVARVLASAHFRERCYFVQDNEAKFHPMGSSALIANWTYKQELACICAGPWLARTLKKQFGRWTRYFNLAFDQDSYYPPEIVGGPGVARSPLRIALYARNGTARRAVELAFLALEHMAADGIKFHVDLFGEDNICTRAPFPCTIHGILNASELAELYRNDDLGMCFSTTNYSLVPQEMMACGLPVVEIDGDSTRAVYPEGVITFTGPHPRVIAADVAALLEDEPRRRQQSADALSWVAQFSWEKSAQAVQRALLDRLVDRGQRQKRTSLKIAKLSLPTKVTVCIPTLNGGDLLQKVVERVRSQRAPWSFEIVIVDSESTDGSIQTLSASESFPNIPLRIERIPKVNFQHGATRNLCAEMAQGEFVAFLTQDAVPTDETWLYNIVTALEHFPKAAGAFGRHTASPTSSPFVRRDIRAHFESLGRYPLALSRNTDADRWRSGEKEWRQILHYFSDNNSCLRRSIWKRVPYPEVDYGEDQIWANTIIERGFEKVYVPFANVYHSHDYTPEETYARASTEALFFATTFGYKSYDVSRGFDEQLAEMDHADRRWARANRISQLELTHQLTLNEATLKGRLQGLKQAVANCQKT